MLSALPVIIVRRSLQAIRRPATILYTRQYASKPIRCDAHMNELPIPCGPWDAYYKDQQARYGKWLVGGILWWIFSFFLMIYTGSLYLNCRAPVQPGAPSDMIEECVDD